MGETEQASVYLGVVELSDGLYVRLVKSWEPGVTTQWGPFADMDAAKAFVLQIEGNIREAHAVAMQHAGRLSAGGDA